MLVNSTLSTLVFGLVLFCQNTFATSYGCDDLARRVLQINQPLAADAQLTKESEILASCLTESPIGADITEQVHSLPSFPDLRITGSSELLIAVSHLLTLSPDIKPTSLRPHVQKSRGRLIWELRDAAAALGHPHAQAHAAVAQIYGISPPPLHSAAFLGPLTEPDVAAGLTHMFFAAVGNDSFARKSLGNRHRNGINMPESCATAVLYLQPVASETTELAAEPRGLPKVHVHRLSELLYSPKGTAEADVLTYIRNAADQGDTDKASWLGRFYSDGSAAVQQDLRQAFKYALKAAEAGDKKSMARLGHMYANGEGVAASNSTALHWFKKSMEGNVGNASGFFGLGYMYLHGYGVDVDYTKALKYLRLSANDGNDADAKYHLAVMWLNGWGMQRPDPLQAQRLFTSAALAEHPLAMYNLAMMQLDGKYGPVDCRSAVNFLALLARRGSHAALYSLAHTAWLERQYEQALWHYLFAAEMGSPVAALNAAWLITHGYIAPSEAATTLALRLSESVLASGNTYHAEARVTLANAYYYGLGVPRNFPAATLHYEEAMAHPMPGNVPVSDVMARRQAAFSIGYMFQFGLGVPQDFNMAKRHYDELAAHPLASESWLAANTALSCLRLHRFWKDYTSQRPWVAAAINTATRNTYDLAMHVLRRSVDPVYAFHNARTLRTPVEAAVAPTGAGSMLPGLYMPLLFLALVLLFVRVAHLGFQLRLHMLQALEDAEVERSAASPEQGGAGEGGQGAGVAPQPAGSVGGGVSETNGTNASVGSAVRSGVVRRTPVRLGDGSDVAAPGGA